MAGAPAPWRRIELAPDTPTEAGGRAIRPRGNLPEGTGAQQAAGLRRARWRIGGVFQRLEPAPNGESRSPSHPRAALPGFAVAVLAHNVLSLLQRCVEQAHQGRKPPPEVSTCHLALHIGSSHGGMLVALPPERWRSANGDPAALADRLMRLARNADPGQAATGKRRPEAARPRGHVDGAAVRAQVPTARVLAQARAATP